MAKRNLKDKVIELRKKGMSYSQIKDTVQVSKSTLSLWLRDLPLPKERIVELRDKNPKRIENYRNTMKKKREERFKKVYQKVSKDIGKLSKREMFLFGLALYWGEGGKTKNTELSMSNTDPAILKYFLIWLQNLGADMSKLRVRLQLYSDMKENKEIEYWSKELSLPKAVFRKSYIKKSSQSNLSYKQRFFHGTCNIHYGNVHISEYGFASMKYLENMIKSN